MTYIRGGGIRWRCGIGWRGDIRRVGVWYRVKG